jgi:hypothetical protein
MTYTKYKGSIINLTTALDIINLFSWHNNYAANTSVSYHTPFFWGLSTLHQRVPVIKNIGPDDYILITATIPDNSDNYNLFNMTPYFFEYNGVNVFASTDETIPFFTKKDKTRNICITSSLCVATEYEKQGYIISKLPADMLELSTFTLLFRLGVITKPWISLDFIHKFVTCEYYKCCNHKDTEYYTSTFIKESRIYELPLPEHNLTEFEDKKREFINKGFIPMPSHKFLSNFRNVDYPMKHLYDAIAATSDDPKTNRYANLRADNSLEAYYNSDIIKTQGIKTLYIVALNHHTLGVSLTSNIQIYDYVTLTPLRTISTSPELPPFTSHDYPFVETNELPLVHVIKLDIANNFAGVDELMIVERICYDPTTFRRPSYNYQGNFAIFTSAV